MLRQSKAEDSQTRGKRNEDLAPFQVTTHKAAPDSAPWTGEQRWVRGPRRAAAFPPMSTRMKRVVPSSQERATHEACLGQEDSKKSKSFDTSNGDGRE